MSRRLNVQGLARKSQSLLSCLVADDGEIFVSSDAKSAEPSVITHYTQDPIYRLATFDMVGKTPYYRQDGLLIIDDIYLLTASKSPMGEKAVREAFNTTYNGKTFQEQWLIDPEVITKGALKEVRALHKIGNLMIGYSAGPKKIAKTAYEAGFSVVLKDIREFYNLFWVTFPNLKVFSQKLENVWKNRGFIVNDFGYALYPDKPYKCFNAFVQSSVSGVMNLLQMLFYDECPWARFSTLIHDEQIFSVPISRRDETKELFYKSVDRLNELLGWSIKMRFGYAEGKNWYEAH